MDMSEDEDFIEIVNILARNRRRRTYRVRENHFEKWTAKEFLNRFRLPKECVRMIVETIREQITRPTNQNHAVTPEEMVLLTLRFYASGSMMVVVADFMGIDKSTACRIIHKVSSALANLYGEFIKMPATENEIRNKKQDFHQIARFPQCIGALDCSHIKIQSVGGDEAERYRNRKGYFSFNVQVVGDANMFIQDIVCRWPGSSHDSTIFINSRLRRDFENGVYGDSVLVGDSGYGVKKYLITPLQVTRTAPENLFNESQIRTRNVIERLFGVWKRRFPILALGLRVKLANIEAIIIATGILHNIARRVNAPEPDVEQYIEDIIENDRIDDVIIGDQNDGINRLRDNATRYAMINNYFSRLI